MPRLGSLWFLLRLSLQYSSGLINKNKMAVEVVLTRKIERAIFKVKQLDGISRDFLDRLSQYNEDEDKDEVTKEVENEKTIEFAVVREVWQHLKKSNAISGKITMSKAWHDVK
jgi:hypothetical protein